MFDGQFLFLASNCHKYLCRVQDGLLILVSRVSDWEKRFTMSVGISYYDFVPLNLKRTVGTVSWYSTQI